MKTKGFTLTELMIVVVILGVITTLAIPNYVRSVGQARLRDSMQQMRAIHAANEIFRTQNSVDEYLTGTAQNLAYINTNLGLNIIANGMTYSYTRNGADPTLYTVTATATVGSTLHTVTLTQAPLGGGNPSCAGGSACP